MTMLILWSTVVYLNNNWMQDWDPVEDSIHYLINYEKKELVLLGE